MKGIMYALITIIFMMSIIGTSLFVNAQSITDVAFVNHSCEWVNEGWTETVPVYDIPKCVYEAKNDSEVCSTELLRIDYVPHDDYVLECEKYLSVEEKLVDYKLQDYECKDSEKGIVCDSIRDGNGDGVCNSGETCCEIINNKFSCKNGDSIVLPVDGLMLTLPKEKVRI